MKRLLSGPGKHFIWILFAILFIAGGISSIFTKVNYDLTDYLPKDSNTVTGIEILESHFGNNAMIQVMVEELSISEGVTIANTLRDIPGVHNLIWLGDAVDPLTPVELIDPIVLERFYQNDSLLFTVTLDCDPFDPIADSLIQSIRDELSLTTHSLRGEVLDNIEARRVASKEIFKVLLIVIPLAIIVLLMIGRSWFEPVLILANLAVAIAINMGTNVFLDQVSYITLTMVMALQLALSFDYSLFLLHRYEEERENGETVISAIAKATKKTFTSITGSALTTIAGFMALLLMRYSIGQDMGIVLSKGILSSYLTAILLLPIMLFFGAGLLEKTKHRPLFMRRETLKPRRYRGKLFFTVFLALTILVAFFMERRNTYLYGNASAEDPKSVISIDKVNIDATFGNFNPIVILANSVDVSQERNFIDQISASPLIDSVDALSTTVDPAIPRELYPPQLLDQYVSGEFTRLIVYSAVSQENEDMYQMVSLLENAADNAFSEYYLIGSAPATAEIRRTVSEDSSMVLWVTFLAILFVVMILFRSLSIPVILTVLIQGAVWINFAIGYVQQKPLLFIGFLIVSALQMGGTVDYGILLTHRYVEFRANNSKELAIQQAMRKSTLSIITSSFVLASAGFTEGFLSSLPAVSAIGFLIGRGAVLSAVVILFFLPSILLVFDPLIMKTTWVSKRGDIND